VRVLNVEIGLRFLLLSRLFVSLYVVCGVYHLMEFVYFWLGVVLVWFGFCFVLVLTGFGCVTWVDCFV
jgi:hypothetical protein